MEKSIEKTGLINALALLVLGAAGFAIARYTNSLAGQVGVLFIGLGFLVALVSWFQMRLEANERLERLEMDELAQAHGSSALFEAKESDVFPAQRSREQFDRFFVPIFTVFLCLVQAGSAYFLWRWLSKTATFTDLTDGTVALAMFAVFALVLFLLGKFSATVARLEDHRLLRPGASYLLLGAYLSFTVALGIAAVQAGMPRSDLYVARGLCALLALIAVETLIQLILEMYRPRVKGKVERPIYESRLVGLLGQPEGLVTTAAQALDYQFGFRVSETWFYRFFEKALGWLLLLQFMVLLLSTCLVFIDAGEQAVLERFGRRVAVLGPGGHIKLPWPMDKIYRARTEQIQSFEIGVQESEESQQEPVVLWTVAHSKEAEDNFLVANRDRSPGDDSSAETKHTPPVSLITGSIPVQFQITNLISWAYENEDAPSLLQDIARREVVRYCVAADMNELMSSRRLDASADLAARIQAASDEHKLGAKIVSVGLQDIHPPVKVAPDFEKVVSAIHTKMSKILQARADDIRTNALSGAAAARVLNEANAYRATREAGAAAQAGLFANQVPAFNAAPDVYMQLAYLQTFTRATANARKYILLTTNTHDVLIFDLQDKFSRDLLDLTPTPKK